MSTATTRSAAEPRSTLTLLSYHLDRIAEIQRLESELGMRRFEDVTIASSALTLGLDETINDLKQQLEARAARQRGAWQGLRCDVCGAAFAGFHALNADGDRCCPRCSRERPGRGRTHGSPP
jgi:hypothetical protein